MITLRHLHVESFKGLDNVDLSFPEHGSILIEGHNEAGKSTLFEAVYVALYGEPLVGEESRPRLEEVIKHGQPQALVELTFAVGAEQLTIRRVLRRELSQQARLTIRQSNGHEEAVNRPTAVNRRILQELNNLDGENLRNSCFVEQKELGRLEDMNPSKREQAIQSLLGLERLTKLSDQFKFKREQERELDNARRLLDLAYAQQEVRALVVEEQAAAERLDATRIAAQLTERTALEEQRTALQGQSQTNDLRETDLRRRLEYADRIRGQISRCNVVQQQLERATAQRETVERLKGTLAEMDAIERQTIPETRAQLDRTLTALKSVVDAEEKRVAVRDATGNVQEAQRAVAELERAKGVVRQRAETLNMSRTRADQHRQEAASSREQNQRELALLSDRRHQLSHMLERVMAWEHKRDTLEAVRQQIRDAEKNAQRLAELRATLQQREEAARQAADVVEHAERERQQAESYRRQAEGYEALQEWIRLKEVEASLSDFAQDRTTLEEEHQHAADAYASTQVRTRRLLYQTLVITLLAMVVLVAGAILSSWILVIGAILAVVAIFCGGAYWRSRAAVAAGKLAVQSVANKLRDLTMRYQAAVHAEGDPARLSQRARALTAAGFAVPTSLDAARKVLAKLSAGDAIDYQRARALADEAVTTLARLKAEAERAEGDANQAKVALHDLEAQGDASVTLRELHIREAMESKEVEAAEVVARDATTGELSWPTNQAQIQVTAAACQAEQQTIQRTMAEAAVQTKRLERDDEDAITQAHQALRTAEDAVAALRMPDPQAKLTDAQANLAHAKELARAAEAQAQLAVQGMGLSSERTAVEAERGRVEERLRNLESQLTTRPAVEVAFTNAQTTYADMLRQASKALQEIVESAHALAITSLQRAVSVEDQAANASLLAARLDEVCAALASALTALQESNVQTELENILHEKGTLNQRLQTLESQRTFIEGDIQSILAARNLPAPTQYTATALAAVWPLSATASADDVARLQGELEQVRNSHFAASDRERRLTEILGDPGMTLEVEACGHCVQELEEERAICQHAIGIIQETRERIARQVLPTTERNMEILLRELTMQRYWSVRLTPPASEDGQLNQLDYRIRVWDQTAQRYVAKNLFSGGTRDQCSLALRLAFALATLPQELGIAPGFIFLDEPLSAFDAQRAQALVNLLTTGIIAQQFAQVVVISHQHAFDRHAFQYHIRMDSGQVVESDLPAMPSQSSQRTPVHAV